MGVMRALAAQDRTDPDRARHLRGLDWLGGCEIAGVTLERLGQLANRLDVDGFAGTLGSLYGGYMNPRLLSQFLRLEEEGEASGS